MLHTPFHSCFFRVFKTVAQFLVCVFVILILVTNNLCLNILAFFLAKNWFHFFIISSASTLWATSSTNEWFHIFNKLERFRRIKKIKQTKRFSLNSDKKRHFFVKKKKEDFVKILSKNSKSYATIMCHRILKKSVAV